MTRETRDVVMLGLLAVVGGFVMVSVIGMLLLALTGHSVVGQFWEQLFGLVGILAGGLVGFAAGRSGSGS